MTKDARPIWLGKETGGWDHNRILIQLWRDDRLGSHEIAVYGGLMCHADLRTGECFPSVKTIAGYVKANENTVRKAIKILVSAGYLRAKVSKGRNVNHYWLLPPPLLNTSNQEGLDPNPLKKDQLLVKIGGVNPLKEDHELEQSTRTKNKTDSPDAKIMFDNMRKLVAKQKV